MDERPPFLDEHHVLTGASQGAVWQSLTDLLHARQPGAEVVARLVGAGPRGDGPPGFTVADTVPPQRLRLTGRHHFSRYELVFLVEPDGDRTKLSARSYAEFPGVLGRLYRAAVIGSGAHRVLVPRLLRGIARRAS
ncbi:hypothetical protein FPZ12_025115 [Amycolatopsis acidicola]|uniref:DUF2867 domain-containing protein n=1 Tax=Amycolatopsis acidicola TaxID=2596893 RepID=A0A5N0V066_9PSEU|nr:hypothetical protein [Amycolatopsis acidicola]KAA9157455.1 hypothetical protein FPZ12_025115 [Amycolatopsis acidicola]